jgi:putative hydrolases of HD superfamily
MHDLEKLLAFTTFLHKFQHIQRKVFVVGEDRRENDLEHSGQLALVGWYLVSSNKLSLDIDKVIKYALIHDLVEVYAGDVYFYSLNRKDKEEKEHKARIKIEEEFSEFTDLHREIQAYEKRVDEESKFVYALDKLLPILNIYLDKGRSWKLDEVTLEMLKKHKREKIKLSKDIEVYFDKIIEILETHTDDFFKT